MPSCVMKYCKNNSVSQKKTDGITFHKLPEDILMKELWINAIRDNRKEDDWCPSKFSVVCSTHFKEVDLYQTKYGLRRVKKNAVPGKLIKKETNELDNVHSSENPCDISLAQSAEEVSTEHNDGLEDNDSDLESILESPRTNKLRQQARQYKRRLQIDIQKRKTLTQKVRRLKRRNAYLKSILKQLKNKKCKENK